MEIGAASTSARVVERVVRAQRAKPAQPKHDPDPPKKREQHEDGTRAEGPKREEPAPRPRSAVRELSVAAGNQLDHAQTRARINTITIDA